MANATTRRAAQAQGATVPTSIYGRDGGNPPTQSIEVVRDQFKGKDLILFVDRSRPVDRFVFQFGRAKAARLVAFFQANGRGSLERLLEDFVNEQPPK